MKNTLTHIVNYEKTIMFFSTLKDTIQAQSKTNDLFSQNFVIICLKHIQRNVICSLFCQYQPKAPF